MRKAWFALRAVLNDTQVCRIAPQNLTQECLAAKGALEKELGKNYQ